VPPGHDKGNGSGDRPCGNGHGHGHGHGGGNEPPNGGVIIVPWLVAAGWSTRPLRLRIRKGAR
jgi:hypothetical protein